jgi:hypothetical protein
VCGGWRAWCVPFGCVRICMSEKVGRKDRLRMRVRMWDFVMQKFWGDAKFLIFRFLYNR